MAVPWNSVNAAYLLRRAGFGPTAAEVAEFTTLGQAAAVARLVDYESVDNSELEARVSALYDFWLGVIPRPEDYQTLYFNYEAWVFRMLYTTRPLEEKMTLFWHGHFATSYLKVGFADMMQAQIDMLRRNAMGSFERMLVDVSADTAMLIWLDNYLSVADDPNENYAREILELFSLSIGHYSEDDINEIARCFTGWTIRVDANAPGGYTTLFAPGIHDFGGKAVLGELVPANLPVARDGERVCEIIADHPQCVRYIATKLWHFFAAGEPPTTVLDRMTAAYAANDHSIREMLRVMFLADEFYARAATDQQVKSPYELIAGTMRTLEIDPDWFTDSDAAYTMLYIVIFTGVLMGQGLYLPPNVKGWDGGREWINTSTILHRYNFGTLLATERQGPLVDVAGLVARSGATSAEGIVDYFLTLLGPLDVGTAARARLVAYLYADDAGNPGTSFTPDAATIDKKVRGLLQIILSSPEYQLNLKGADPGLVAPAIVSPVFKKGKLLLTAAGSNLQQGAALRVTGDTVSGTERFPLTRNGKGTKWVVGKRATSTPSGMSIAAVLAGGTRVTFVIENPDGGQSTPVEFAI
jgi:uncharacterized protein (DUF1800 family)